MDYDGSSTESECYDEELLALAVENASAPDVQSTTETNSTTEVKVELEGFNTNSNAAETQDSDVKTKSTFKKCKRCRRKLPVVSEKEQSELLTGNLQTKRCACCCEDFPPSKFSLSNRAPERAIPRCRSCSQAPFNVLRALRSNPQYAEAVVAEHKRKTKEREEQQQGKPGDTFQRKSTKQRWNEQFQLVGGKTARERRVQKREEERKHRLASIRAKRTQK